MRRSTNRRFGVAGQWYACSEVFRQMTPSGELCPTISFPQLVSTAARSPARHRHSAPEMSGVGHSLSLPHRHLSLPHRHHLLSCRLRHEALLSAALALSRDLPTLPLTLALVFSPWHTSVVGSRHLFLRYSVIEFYSDSPGEKSFVKYYREPLSSPLSSTLGLRSRPTRPLLRPVQHDVWKDLRASYPHLDHHSVAICRDLLLAIARCHRRCCAARVCPAPSPVCGIIRPDILWEQLFLSVPVDLSIFPIYGDKRKPGPRIRCLD